MNLATIAQNQLKNVSTGQVECMEALWKDKPCVFIFFRRWGCMFCRLWAKEINVIASLLKENNVRLIGVGFQELGVEEFVKGNFFEGELYIDVEKKTYKTLAFKRFSLLGILASLVIGESRAAISRGRQMKLGGDLKGDGQQNGGALIVASGGKEILLNFKQDRPAEHLANNKILKALGLGHLAVLEGNSKNDNGISVKSKCNDDICSLPVKEGTKAET